MIRDGASVAPASAVPLTPLAATAALLYTTALDRLRSSLHPPIHDTTIDEPAHLASPAVVPRASAELGRGTIEAERLHACSYVLTDVDRAERMPSVNDERSTVNSQ